MPIKSSSLMPSVSQIEKHFGTFTNQPRPGQQDALKALQDYDQSLNVKLPTGYGKTFVALAAYSILSQVADRVNRNLIVVPTKPQLDQLKDARLSDFGISGSVVDIGFFGQQAIKKHLSGKAEVYATTIQALRQNAGLIVDAMMSDGSSWMVTVDEYHHYGDGLPFADAVEALNPTFRLCMSATPMRSNDDMAFGSPDVSVDYRQAVEEGVVKTLIGEAYHYVLDIQEGDELRSVSIEDMKQEAGSSSPEAIEKLIIKREMRWLPKYISPLIEKPIQRMLNTRISTGKRAKAVIGAMCVSHAELICKQVKTAFQMLNVEWVGTGPNGRKDADNKEIIKRFRDESENGVDVLVHVGMAGEGLDVPLITEVVHCNGAGLNVSNNQENGRGARFCEGLPECHIGFDASSEYAIRGYIGDRIMDAMEFQPPKEITEEEKDKNENEDWEWDDLPDELNISIANIRFSHIEKGDPRVQDAAEAIANSKYSGDAWDEIKDDEDHPIFRLAIQAVEMKQQRAAEAMNEESTIIRLRSDLDASVRVLAGNIGQRVMKSTGIRLDGSFIGDLMKRIRAFLKRKCGKLENDLEIVKKHYSTLKRLEVKIKNNGVPSWLR